MTQPASSRVRHWCFHIPVRFGAAWLIVLGVLEPTTTPALVVEAASLIVTTTADPNPSGDGLCSLREAIYNANADLDITNGDCAAGSGADIITFSVTGIISLTQVPATLTHALPTITTPVTLIGPGAANLTIRVHANSVGVFAVGPGGTFTLSGLRVADGLTTGMGGGIFNDGGTVTVADSIFHNNRASNHGGAIYSNGVLTVSGMTFTGNNTDANGGGIYSTGLLIVNNSTFTLNQADGDGGAIYGDLSVSESTFSGNSAGGDGGGIWCLGVTVTGSTFSSNTAIGNGGGIYSLNGGTVMVTGSTFTSNSAGGAGGGLYGGEGNEINVTDSTFTGNSAGGGGAIANLDGTLIVTLSTIANNTAVGGGGIAGGVGSNTVISSTISGNSATAEGGGITTSSGIGVIDSTLSNNSALDGGGIYIGTDAGFAVSNSTLSANTATRNGGGFFHSSGARNGTLANVTFYGNGAASGGAIFNEASGVVLTRTLVAYSASGNNCAGPVAVTDGGLNVQTASQSCGNTILSHASTPSFCSLLDPLQNNGGPTHTHALRFVPPGPPCPASGNPAIDTVPLISCNFPTDQRGAARPHGPACDIGAFEYGSIAPGGHQVYLPLIVR